MSVEDFYTFANQPGHAERHYELIDGEVVEVPSNAYASVIASLISFYIHLFLQKNDVRGYISGEGGGFVIDGHVFAPDVAYMRDLPTDKGFEQQPPLLAVEVLSDPKSNAEQSELRRKLGHYRRAGVVVWVVDYVARKVEIHLPDNTVNIYGDEDKLTGGDVLPGFELPVKDIFPNEEKA